MGVLHRGALRVHALQRDGNEVSGRVGPEQDRVDQVENPLHDGSRNNSSDTGDEPIAVDVELKRLFDELLPVLGARKQVQELAEKVEVLSGHAGDAEDGCKALGDEIPCADYDVVFGPHNNRNLAAPRALKNLLNLGKGLFQDVLWTLFFFFFFGKKKRLGEK